MVVFTLLGILQLDYQQIITMNACARHYYSFTTVFLPLLWVFLTFIIFILGFLKSVLLFSSEYLWE